ncbi:MAG: PQQ-dependent sugar dehydrogenase [Nitriliruptorales bacterium]|nr:PQQ-dependent sugar dehydrogenase [Nitriliruptorales bacterium]
MRFALLAILSLTLGIAGCRGDDPGEEPLPSPTLPSPVDSPTSAPPDEPSPGSTGVASPTVTAPAQTIDDVRLAAEEVVSGLASPLLVTAPPGGGGIWVLEQPGIIRVIDGDQVRTFLDIRSRVTSGGERGLLGLAFHPDYADNGRVFVHYSGDAGRTVLSEFATSGDPSAADPGSEQVLLTVRQPASNHNGGSVVFGPDGLLYLALGDGGGGGDQFGNGQDPSTLLGALLRIDVTDEGEYAIPDDNPFVDGGGAPEVYSYGLRNPYRIAFGADGLLYIADVGQNAVEEVNALDHRAANGANFGWPILEGTRCFREADCNRSGTVLPVIDYTHAETGGCSVIGGEEYTGEAIPGLAGHYFYSDLCAGFLRSIAVEDGEVIDQRDWTEQLGQLGRVLSIGKDARGELYVTEAEGRVLRLVPAG